MNYINIHLNSNDKEKLNDKYIIKINEYVYDIPNFESYINIQKNYFNYVLKNKTNLTIGIIIYKVEFINNDKTDLVFSVYYKEYINELLDNINIYLLNSRLNILNIKN